MTTKKQIRSLAKALIRQNPDLCLVSDVVFVQPVRNIARFILLDRTSNALRFKPRWGAIHLCEMVDYIYLNWAPAIGVCEQWSWDNPSLQDDLLSAVDKEALPRLRSIQTLDDYVFHTMRDDEGFARSVLGSPLSRIAIEIARGRLDVARGSCAALPPRDGWASSLYKDELERTAILCRLLAADDRAAMARLLHDWEAYTVAKLGIDHLWEPTPFPLEAQASIGDGRPEQTAD